jgi:hypothetical protein
VTWSSLEEKGQIPSFYATLQTTLHTWNCVHVSVAPCKIRKKKTEAFIHNPGKAQASRRAEPRVPPKYLERQGWCNVKAETDKTLKNSTDFEQDSLVLAHYFFPKFY